MEGKLVPGDTLRYTANLDAVEVVVQSAAVTDEGQLIPRADRHSAKRCAGTVFNTAAIKLHHRGSTQLNITICLRGGGS